MGFALQPMGSFGGGWNQQECRVLGGQGSTSVALAVGGVQPCTLRRLVVARLGKRDPDQNPAARPGASLVLHKVVCLLQLTGPLTTRFCIVLLRNLNVQSVKRGIKALTITFNYYLYFLERSSSQNKILNRNEIHIIHLFFLLGFCPA